MWRKCCIAGRFLTRLPFPDVGNTSDREMAAASVCYPLTGLLVGLICYLLARLMLPLAGVELTSLVILIVWVWASGALHLDGLADTVDAWIGGLGSRERTLEIMKDPHTGTMAVVVLVLFLLSKWLLIKMIVLNGQLDYLLWPALISRLLLPLWFVVVPYAKSEGLGVLIAAEVNRKAMVAILVMTLIALWFLTFSRLFLLCVMTAFLLFHYWRYLVVKRLGGTTGDTAGAFVEILELGLLLVLAVA